MALDNLRLWRRLRSCRASHPLKEPSSTSSEISTYLPSKAPTSLASAAPIPPLPKGPKKRWGVLGRYATVLRQSFSQLKVESSRTRQEAREPAPCFPKNMTESDDMIVILNARGTVILNFSFRRHSHQIHIVALAALAVRLWGVLSAGAKEGDVQFPNGISSEAKAWM